MSIVDEIQKMLNQQVDFNEQLKEAMNLQRDLLEKGIIKRKTYNLPMPDALGPIPGQPVSHNKFESGSGTAFEQSSFRVAPGRFHGDHGNAW